MVWEINDSIDYERFEAEAQGELKALVEKTFKAQYRDKLMQEEGSYK